MSARPSKFDTISKILWNGEAHVMHCPAGDGIGFVQRFMRGELIELFDEAQIAALASEGRCAEPRGGWWVDMVHAARLHAMRPGSD